MTTLTIKLPPNIMNIHLPRFMSGTLTAYTNEIRITEEGEIRITEDGETRITDGSEQTVNPGELVAVKLAGSVLNLGLPALPPSKGRPR